jgi:cardiolipin synthase
VFFEEYLQDLRRERFSPPALIHYARRASAEWRRHMDANPGAVRSIWSIALGFFAAAFIAAAVMAITYDRHLAYDFFLGTSLAIVPAFGLVTLHVGLLRDREGFRLSALNLPTTLTLLRVVLVPALTLFLVDRHFLLALATFAIAELTDVADGWIARRTGQVTMLGTVLDPLVDIVFNLSVFGALAVSGLLPAWVGWVAVARYALLLVGGACMYLFVGPLRIQPTLFGRMTGVVMAALVAFLTLLHVSNGPLPESLTPLTEIALGVLLSATVAQVLILGWYNLRIMTGRVEAPGRVVGDVRWGAR